MIYERDIARLLRKSRLTLDQVYRIMRLCLLLSKYFDRRKASHRKAYRLIKKKLDELYGTASIYDEMVDGTVSKLIHDYLVEKETAPRKLTKVEREHLKWEIIRRKILAKRKHK